jgi:hypothetical protein
MNDFDLKAELKVLQDFQMKNCDLSGTTIAVDVYRVDGGAFIALRVTEWIDGEIYMQATRTIETLLSAKNAIEGIVLELTGSYEV